MISQVKGKFQVRDPLLMQYLQKVKNLMMYFGNCIVKHIPREENTRTNLLSELASAKKQENNKSIIQHNLAWPSITKEDINCSC